MHVRASATSDGLLFGGAGGSPAETSERGCVLGDPGKKQHEVEKLPCRDGEGLACTALGEGVGEWGAGLAGGAHGGGQGHRRLPEQMLDAPRRSGLSPFQLSHPLSVSFKLVCPLC